MAFLADLRHCLVPTLKRGDSVVMDNLPTHKVKGVRDILEKAGAQLCYPPPCSPELNPIENGLRQAENADNEAPQSEPSTACKKAPTKARNAFSETECPQFLQACRLGVKLTGKGSRAGWRVDMRICVPHPVSWKSTEATSFCTESWEKWRALHYSRNFDRRFFGCHCRCGIPKLAFCKETRREFFKICVDECIDANNSDFSCYLCSVKSARCNLRLSHLLRNKGFDCNCITIRSILF